MSIREDRARWCTDVGIPVPDESAWQRLLMFRDELLRWNRKMNLTADRDPDRLFHRHVLDSLVPLAILPGDLDVLLDVGSGGGFPAIPLAICRPEVSFVLVERVARKCAWLRAVTRKLGMSHVRVVESDLEDLGLEVTVRWAITRAVRVDGRLCSNLSGLGVERLVTFDTTPGEHRVLGYRLPEDSRDRWLSIVPLGQG